MTSSNDERGEWAEPLEMLHTYAFLYNTFEIGNARYLPAQMQEQLWRFVYGQSARPRSLCWSQQFFTFKQRRQVGERAIPTRPDKFAVPLRTFDPVTKRSFEIQNADGYLCGMHTLNNVANAVVLSPPDLLSAIELVRPLTTRFAAPEELALAALQEGVFLLPIKLIDASDLNPLDATETYPRNKCCLSMIEEARGMIVFMPLHGDQAMGHFVSLVYAEPTGGGTPAENRWLVYNSSQVVARGATAASALDKFILERLNNGIDIDEETRELRRRRLEEGGISSERFVGLLPISLRLLQKDALLRGKAVLPRGAKLQTKVSDFQYDDYIELVMLRTLVRRSLSEMRALPVPGAANEFELVMPDPISPTAIDDLCWLVHNKTVVDKRDQDYSLSALNGLDLVNPASLYLTRHTVDAELNNMSNELAEFVVAEYRNKWTAEAFENAAGFPLDMAERYRGMIDILARIRSYLNDPTASLGLFLTGSTVDDDNDDNFDKFRQLLSNRRWFRYFVLVVASSVLINSLRAYVSGAEGVLEVPLRRLLVLFCSVAYKSLNYLGVKIASSPPRLKLYGLISRNRYDVMPSDSLPEQLQDVFRDDPMTTQSPFFGLFVGGGYQYYLWLLRATRDIGSPFYALPSLAPFEILRPPQEDVPYDIDSMAYDESLRFVTIVRTTLFAIPASDADASVHRRFYYEQAFNQPTRLRIGEHYHSGATRFIDSAIRERFLLDEATARTWIDVLAFDERFAGKEWRQTVADDISVHDYNDESKPRLIERAALAGFDVLKRRVFGETYLAPDDRDPILNNVRRLPLPYVEGNWRATRPTITDDNELCVTPLVLLEKFSERRAYDASVFLASSSESDRPMTRSSKRSRVLTEDDDYSD